MMTPKEAWNLIGGLSTPSKMPGYSWSISAKRCKTGAKLRNVANSVCSICYALKGNYNFPCVVNALERRFQAMSNPLWVEAMVIAIGHYNNCGYFRFFDSGDLQDLEHLEKIVEIVKRLPKMKFWLPTREYGIVGQFKIKHKNFPKNLTIRLSSYMIDGPPPPLAKAYGVQSSGVSKDGFTCPASKQFNSCRDCRKCWDPKVQNINYKKH
jgi:Gene product 88